MEEKWYQKTIFIGICFALWPLYGIPLIIGIVLAIQKNSREKELFNSYGDYDTVCQKIKELQPEYEEKRANLEKEYSEKKKNLKCEYGKYEETLKETTNTLESNIKELRKDKGLLESELLIAHYNFSDYDGITSEECKNKLSLLKTDESSFVKSGNALFITSEGTRKEINDNKKQILRCFNTECDNVLVNLTHKNIDSMRNKITRSFESLNKIFAVDGIEMNKELLEMKLEELNLVYTYELKRQQELELQKEIKEQMREEEKVRREIERQKSKIEKDQAQCSKEMNKLMSYIQKTENDIEKQLYIDKIHELEEKIKSLEKDKETVLEREANARAGYVYIISNIGSFGSDVYKIGMTRRLEPMDRIKELSSASVPFDFDVHAMIFSDNAPELENLLHKKFEKNSVNRVNYRKEFFKVSLDEIEDVVLKEYNNTVKFTKVPAADQYRETLRIIETEKETA
ncbi:DUF4041 domain-containing protein [Anaerostipes hominis (ex Lee et al. 2021)]|uniref:DUF4041 domain-containing protein n=1 Tax=Anaerostipes hominis (ex Lee et al. 2021) TaxID=2025494 RepID=UPI0022E56187|nr:DUF4041 domain-containing protein [Anaerostipes hominis (ex Lee et al. 2021)]